MQSYEHEGQQQQRQPYATPGYTPHTSYSTPGSQQQSSTKSGLILLILKIVSLLLGIIAMSLALHGYFNADWFHRSFHDMIGDCRYDCKVLIRNPDTKCEEDINAILRSRTNLTQYQLGCPSRWLVIPQVVIITFVWVGTLVGLILFNAAGASQNQNLPLLDMIGHFVAGLLIIVSAICLLVFSLDVIIADNCDKLFTMRIRDIFDFNTGFTPNALRRAGWPVPKRLEKRNGPYSRDGNYTFPEYPDPDYTDSTVEIGNTYEEMFKDSCNEEQLKIFFQWHIFSGGLFALFAGIFYIVIGVLALLGLGTRTRTKPQRQGSLHQVHQTQMQQQYDTAPQQDSILN